MKVGRFCALLFAGCLLVVGAWFLLTRPRPQMVGWLTVRPDAGGNRFIQSGSPYQGGMITLNASDQTIPIQYAVPSRPIQPTSWSPDGNYLAYFAMRGTTSTIFIARPDGSDRRELPTSGRFNAYPSWSPDGRWIAYISIRNDQSQLYKIRPDGTDQQLLLSDVHTSTSPSWSPDSRWIAVVRKEDDNWDIYRVRTDGSHLERLTTRPDFDGLPLWSPDGRWIAYTGKSGQTWNLYCVSASGGEPEPLASALSPTLLPVTWSPDSQWIAYVAKSGDLYRVRADDTVSQQLTFSAANDSYPSWSPDGRWIAFLISEPSGRSFLYKMRPDGSQLQKVFEHPVTSKPLWSPQIERSGNAAWKLMISAVLMLFGFVLQFVWVCLTIPTAFT